MQGSSNAMEKSSITHRDNAVHKQIALERPEGLGFYTCGNKYGK